MENFSRDIKIKWCQLGSLKLKNTVTKFKNLIYGFNNRLGTTLK